MLLSERHLIPAWNGVRSTASGDGFDKLCMEILMKSRVVSLVNLPSQSTIIKVHLKRDLAIVRRLLTVPDPNKVVFNPMGNGWFLENEKVFPSKILRKFQQIFL